MADVLPPHWLLMPDCVMVDIHKRLWLQFSPWVGFRGTTCRHVKGLGLNGRISRPLRFRVQEVVNKSGQVTYFTAQVGSAASEYRWSRLASRHLWLQRSNNECLKFWISVTGISLNFLSVTKNKFVVTNNIYPKGRPKDFNHSWNYLLSHRNETLRPITGWTHEIRWRLPNKKQVT